jgi:GntR family transcriptional regulator, transcriptional repressor for pyruvate dehydrogenase complex
MPVSSSPPAPVLPAGPPPGRAYEQIVAQVEGMIAADRLRIGDQLPAERELAEQFDVSRVVIREAMRNLEARGVIEVQHGRGAFVRSRPDQAPGEGPGEAISRSLTLFLRLEESSLIDLYVVRQALEVTSAPLAAQHATPEQIAGMARCLEEMQAITAAGVHSVDDLRASSAKDFEFHGLIAAASGNLPLATLLDPVLVLIKTARLQLVDNAAGLERLLGRLGSLRLNEEHGSILTAITNRDAAAAQYFMYQHLQQSIVTYRDLS